METNKELNALFKLIDDPDEEVFSAVTNRLVVYGKSIIPQLEYLWENTVLQPVQDRIEVLVHDPLAEGEEAVSEYGIHLADWTEMCNLDGLVLAVAHQQYKAMTAADPPREGVDSFMDDDAWRRCATSVSRCPRGSACAPQPFPGRAGTRSRARHIPKRESSPRCEPVPRR